MVIRRFVAALLASAVFACIGWGAEIYRWTDAQGNIHYGDRPPAGVKTKEVTVRVNTYDHASVSELQSVFFPEAKLVILTASWCGVCRQAKQYFRERKIPYEEYDVETTELGGQLFAQLNGNGVPIILVGKHRLNGFSPTVFEALFEQTQG